MTLLCICFTPPVLGLHSFLKKAAHDNKRDNTRKAKISSELSAGWGASLKKINDNCNVFEVSVVSLPIKSQE